MTLKTKSVIFMALIFVLFTIVNIGTSRFFILPGFFALEREDAETNMKRCIRAIEREIEYVDTFCHDWSAWDAAYEFVENPSPDFIEKNLTFSTFQKNSINLIYICNSQNQVVWGEVWDIQEKTPIRTEAFPPDALPGTHPLLQFPRNRNNLAAMKISGILMTEKGILMVSSRPILRSQNQGPSRGTMIMGRFLDETLIKEIIRQIQFDFRIYSVDTKPILDILEDVPNLVGTPSGYYIHAVRDRFLVYSVYRNVRGKPGFLIRLEMERAISAIGYQALKVAFFFFLLSGVVISLYLLFLVKKIIVRPINLLTSHTENIVRTGNLNQRIHLDTKDEFSALSDSFNRMMATIENQAKELVRVNRELARDNEKRKKVEAELKESEARYRSFVQNFQGIAIRIRDNGVPEFIHGAVKEITGYSQEEYMENLATWEKILHPDDRENLAGKMQNAFLEENSSGSLEYRIIRKDRKIRWIQCFYRSIPDKNGIPVCVDAALHDITKRKTVESELVKSERYYRFLLVNMHDDILVVDEEHRITDANREYITSAHMDRKEMIGRFAFEVFPAFAKLFDRRDPDAELVQVFASQKPDQKRVRHANESGEERWTELLFSPMPHPPEKEGRSGKQSVIIAMRDVTKEAELEAQLFQARKMEAIGTLAGGIAHDFNNVLMTIMVNLDYALSKTQDTRVQESLSLSHKAALRAKEFVEQILTFSRKTDIQEYTLHLIPIAEESLKMLRASIPPNIRMETRMDAENDLVFASSGQINQILMNLCTNASYAMKNTGGLLCVHAENLEMDSGDLHFDSSLSPGAYLRLRVSDTGTGIPEKALPRIFDPYYTTKPTGEGTGMGLAVVHGILKKIGAGAEVKSSEGSGTVFDVYFPVCTQDPGEKAREARDAKLEGGRFLIVDDEPDILISLKNVLEEKGCTVTTETSSLQALARFRNAPRDYDMVLTDHLMPEMDGMEMAEKIKEIRGDIPIAVLTGFNDPELHEKMLAAGVGSILMKPVQMNVLENTLYQLLG